MKQINQVCHINPEEANVRHVVVDLFDTFAKVISVAFFDSKMLGRNCIKPAPIKWACLKTIGTSNKNSQIMVQSLSFSTIPIF